MKISLPEAIQRLQNGEVVAIPTETVYGLAACVHQPKAIAHIFSLKNRPLQNPLIIHVAHYTDIAFYVNRYPPHYDELAHAFWPGAFTCILPIDPNKILTLVRAGLHTAAFRIPSLSITQQLLSITGPLVMPSANLSGKPSSTLYTHVEEDFGKDFPILEGEVCPKGLESTILAYEKGEWQVARLGALAAEVFIPILGYQPQILNSKKQPICPGQLFRHYAPKAKLVIGDLSEQTTVQFIIGFKEKQYPLNKRILYIGSLENPEEVGENLYRVLRQLDEEEAPIAWIDMDFPAEGLWATIRERFLRAVE
jgi:L-threonylcarbamoyladenylate synthase